MELSQFLSILDSKLSHLVEPDSIEHKVTSKNKLLYYLGLFVIDDSESELLDKTQDYCGRFFSGGRSLTSTAASYYLSNYDSNEFENKVSITDDCKLAMIEDFRAYDETISDDNFFFDVSELYKRILERISNSSIYKNIRKVEFIPGNKLLCNGKILSLPSELIPTDAVEGSEKYVIALLEVYAQNEKRPPISLDDLDEMSPLYREHIKLQRKRFFKAESARRKVRDFDNGDVEFEALKEEILEYISGTLIKKHKNAMDRVEATLSIAEIHITITKSFLGRNTTGLIGPSERTGIVHMLVNDDKIKWVVDYDEDI